MQDLTTTLNLQPALTAVSLATLAILQKEGPQASITAGHSLGEYSALCAAGVLTKEDTIRAVNRRGELMHREATRHEGAMAAIVGLSMDTVRQIVSEAEADGIVSVANHNAKEQIVITGEPAAVQKAGTLAAAYKGRSVPLKVSGAWHSALIRGAEDDFSAFLESIPFNTPQIPVLHNASADMSEDPDEIRSLMVTQLCHPVRWYDSMNRLMDQEIEVFVEVGPGKVLAGLLKKTIPADYPHHIYRINDMKSLDKFLSSI
jgi:[acyl-carrier-protein] S-malonyltransferase